MSILSISLINPKLLPTNSKWRHIPNDLRLPSYTWTGVHVGQNFDCVRYSKIAGLSTSLMWHGGLNLVQSCKMWCAVCTLPHSHKSEPHRPIDCIMPANRPTLVIRRFSWSQAFLGWSQPGGCGANTGMKDWRAGGIGVVHSPLIDNNFAKERRGFLERRCFGAEHERHIPRRQKRINVWFTPWRDRMLK